MYVPAHFAAGDLDEIAAFVDRTGAADLVTFDGARPVSTLLPVMWDRSDGQDGRLIGHMARGNPQWRAATPVAHGRARRGRAGGHARAAGLHLAVVVREHQGARPDRPDLELHDRALHRPGHVQPEAGWPQDRAGVIAALQTEPGPGGRAIAALMAEREPHAGPERAHLRTAAMTLAVSCLSARCRA